jgi:hypothetical protein
MKNFVSRSLLVGIVAASFIANARAQDPVSFWNGVAEKAVKTAKHSPPVAALDLAIVHMAIYDAVESIDGRYQPYFKSIAGASGSMSAAAAKAGHDVLVALFPGQNADLDTTYDNFLNDNGIDGLDPGVDVGKQAATAILGLRSNDGRFPPNFPPFVGNEAIGQWRPTPSFLPEPPPSLAPGLTPWVASVTPFTMTAKTQFRVDPPPDTGSAQWAEDFNEVKAFGSLNSSVRNAEQTDIGYFWADNGPLMWQNALRDIASRYLSDIGDTARMYALAEASLADAQIACWESKYFYNFWRPVTAIRLGDLDGNANTDVDLEWQPLINTPNFPEYPSGHASTSGAVTRVLQLFFGTDRVTFQMASTNPHALLKTRTFSSFSQSENEVIDARVYVGIHYRTSDRAARAQGLRVADWVFKNYFRPMGDPRFGAHLKSGASLLPRPWRSQ